MVAKKKLFKARRSINAVKQNTFDTLQHQIETGVKKLTLEKKRRQDQENNHLVASRESSGGG